MAGTCALQLKDFTDEDIDINRVIKMLLIHDLGEIDAGDTIIYASETNELKSEEAAGVNRLSNVLPDGMGSELMELWREFESAETADSRFAKAMDGVPPLPHNIHGSGHSCKAHGITKEKVFSVNQRIEARSKELWSAIRSKLEDTVDEGVLK